MGNIFSDNPVFAVGTILGLFGILASHRLILYRDRKKSRDDAASEVRNLLNQTIVDITDRHMPSGIMFEMQKRAILNFRPFVNKNKIKSYDETREKYYTNYRAWEFCAPDHRQSLIACISDLMNFIK